MTLENLKELVSTQSDIDKLLDEKRATKEVWKHRASSTTSFLANPLHYALVQGLGVFFGSTDKTLIGTAVHSAVDYAYSNPNKGVFGAIKEIIKSVDEELKNLQKDLVGKVNSKEL